MSKATLFALAFAAIVIAFIASRATETSRFIGDDANPGIFDLFTSASHKKMTKSSDGYIQKVSAFINGTKSGQDSSMIDDYYNIVTTFYEYGWGDQFHFAQLLAGEDHDSSLARHERDIAYKMGIGPEDHVLDAGSGVGGPARVIHAATGATITGITINEFQIERARFHTQRAGMSDKVKFVQGDYTNMPFDDNTFDKVYSIEATCHTTNLIDVYKEIFRVLKHGGVYGSYEWLSTKYYDRNNQQHIDWMHDIEFGSGLPPMHTFDQVINTANSLGFELVFEHDFGFDTDIAHPWYYKLDMSTVSTTITHYFTAIMETLGLAETGSLAAHSALLRAVRGLVGGGRAQIFTPMHMFIFRKPLIH